MIRRKKNGQAQAIPVTPRMAEVIDSTPSGQHYLLVTATGAELQPERAAQIVRHLKALANERADAGKGMHIRDELRLYDMRGTAATELLRAGCSLGEIAVVMGWGLRHAANVIEKYAALVPEVSDEVLRKLNRARARETAGGRRSALKKL